MPSPFRPALELLTMYATYHRDKRNIATHFVGIPMIVFSLGVLLGRPTFEMGGWLSVTPIAVLWVLTTLWYLTRGEFALGLITSVVNGALMSAAAPLAQQGAAQWLAWGVGSFVVGWVIQFIGHYYEGRKPAFADDLIGLLVGPQFVVAEALFGLGLFKTLAQAIEKRAGPTHVRDLSAPPVSRA